ncbi:translesion error-prone DNA polymerase V autoproteolytic subunit [Allomuricauda sp. d1]|uniref:LexA family protein n=1 Tax=Allomuricauda sp. d1 TaxID=3136725 RepID=UPI0031D7DE24
MKRNEKTRGGHLQFYGFEPEDSISASFSKNTVSAGFPSPADDFKETRISLDKSLIKNPDATFFARVSGDSMIGAGLDDGDLLVIDRSLEPENGKVAVCFIDGEFTVKRLEIKKDGLYLMPENRKYKPLKVEDENNLLVWGIVTHVIKAL